MTPAELGRERMVLVAVPQTPYTQVRLAMLLGHPRVQQDLGKGLALLDSVLKSSDPAAQLFHPLARQVADNVLFMDGGVIVEYGKAEEVIGNPREERTRQFLERYSNG